MSTAPEDLKPVHQKYAELCQAKGSEFALGFLTYMVEVAYHKSEPDQVLARLVRVCYAGKFGHAIEDLLTRRVASDLVNGFVFAQTYSKLLQDPYKGSR